MHGNEFFVIVFIGGLYFLWSGIILLMRRDRIRRDPLWRFTFVFANREIEELYLMHSRPLGVLSVCVGIILSLGSLLELLGFHIA